MTTRRTSSLLALTFLLGCTARATTGFPQGDGATGDDASSTNDAFTPTGDTPVATGDTPVATNDVPTTNPDAGSPVTPACASCVQSMCGSQLAACSADPTCLPCLGNPTAACTDNETFYSLGLCACAGETSDCREECSDLCLRL